MADGSKERKKRTGTFYSHLALAYTSPRGLEAVRQLHEKDPLTKDLVKRTIKHLKDLGHEPRDLEAWYSETFITAAHMLAPGEKRARTVQVVNKKGKAGRPFVRITLDPASWKPGDTVYEERTLDGKIVIG